jgi:hypothetical protein
MIKTTRNRVIFSRKTWEELKSIDYFNELIEAIEDREELIKAIEETEYTIDYDEYKKQRKSGIDV